LPRVVLPAGWFAEMVGGVTKALRETLGGIEGTVLRHLAEQGEEHVCEIEAHAPATGIRPPGCDG